MGPPPVVTGISPKEASAGTKITIRGEKYSPILPPKHPFNCSFPKGENLGVSPNDLIGILISGADCLMTADWKSSNKVTVLCPGGAKEGKGDIIVATRSGGLGSSTVQMRIFKVCELRLI